MLRFNENNGSFILFTNEEDRAEKAGLTLSNSIRGPKGEKVYFTSDHNRNPHYNPFAVLEFYNEADEGAKSRLEVIKKEYDASWATDCEGHIPVPHDKEYMPYQKAGINYAVRQGSCVIGDEPGLGKTIQALGVANATGAEKVLVLCPASIRLNWKREILEWSTLKRLKIQPILKGSDGVNPFSNFTICSYDLTRNHGIHTALRSQKWDMIVCDEGHYLKSVNAQRTRAMFGGGLKDDFFYRNGLNQSTDRIVALTGTPLPNRPREAYTLARGLNWECIDYLSEDAFQYRFNPSIQMETGYKIEAKGRLPELNARLRGGGLMVRRLKSDVLKQLPDKRYEMTYIEPDGAIREILAKESLIDFDPQDLFSPDFTLDGTPISTLRREMGEAMVPRVIDYMKYMLDIVEHKKLVLFAHHNSVMDALAAGLSKYGVSLHRGGMSSQAKENAKADFIGGSNRIIICQLDTMEGLDGLQHICDAAVFAEPAWTPGRNEQCVDRLHRFGQHGNVVAHFLLVENSFNEKVLNAVLDKAHDIHESLDRRIV